MKTRAKLEQENAKIQDELAQARASLLNKEAVIKAKNTALESKDVFIDQLKEALVLAQRRQFAKATETLRSLQSELFDESEVESRFDLPLDGSEADAVKVPAHTRKRSGRKKLPEDLPRVEIVHDLSDDEKVCPHDGSSLKLIGEKTSEQLDIIPMQIQVIRHIRKQYACDCCQQQGNASKPKQAIEKSQASAGLLAYIAVGKYADSLPLYRQSTILGRFGIEMSRTTLANWMIKCGELLQPLINRFEEQLLSQPYLHMDETPLNEAGKAAESKSYMWVRSAGLPDQRLVLFDYDPSRSGAVPRKLLLDYQGALMVDGYGAESKP